ncbi:glycosyltransferase family 4 protein [uncultured Algibacter sp.]|uniref:glycosyltransferase family 4 protein n=1 Tax=uncultured Algibacter sp. TaxID=298659 RepID=UPI0032172233
MRFLIISHTLHKQEDSSLFAYAPYVREMNLWLKHVKEIEIVAPKTDKPITNIDIAYKRGDIIFNKIPSISFTSVKKSLLSLIQIPVILISIFNACKRADHIHLRCPGNIGFLGCLVQVFFPNKIKTAKYAGNWDPKSRQPFSYRFQKAILRSTVLSKKMTVLVYGVWKNQSKNIKPFFTASFKHKDIILPIERDYSHKLHIVFIGSLVKGKNPLLAIKIVEALLKSGIKVKLELYAEGVLREELQRYIVDNSLEDIVDIKGSQNKETIKETLKRAHFSILPSKSEGWPKAVAEAMFFGTIPIATKISCVPYMLDYGARGILIEANLENAVAHIKKHLKDVDNLKTMSKKAIQWSQNYTLDTFETEIIKLIK